ncbi:DNA-binding transcriptional regulator, LysR family [Actinoalloteichus cyanogriseus DSM 43889]|uniref:DNA-binding transcriptional regulator, LysR family n=1 Tax=Actinoalloteichus caeruleus DSM 43889 TaxID=1120930 RepID=A0ABT1JIV5_ACTCY|nr:DNA-binding transcriptional regulator, LysR family [Actinoalloteichus caeruleus DSM 43889]
MKSDGVHRGSRYRGQVDTNLLRTFLAVARTGNFTRAGLELHVVQSTVTSHVRALESELGVRLLDRLPSGARLTQVGRRVAELARGVLDAEHQLLLGARGGDVVEGEVVIGATESVCAYRLPPVVAGLMTSFPDLRVRLHPLGTAAALRELSRADGGVDIALVLEEEVAGDHAVTRIGREPVALVAGAEHPAASGPQSWHDLAGYTYFLMEEGCHYTDRFLRDLRAATGGRPRVTHFGSVEAARSCVEAGLGLSVLPVVAVGGPLAERTLLRVDGPVLAEVPLLLVTSARRWASPAVTAVAEAIARSVGPPPRGRL